MPTKPHVTRCFFIGHDLLAPTGHHWSWKQPREGPTGYCRFCPQGVWIWTQQCDRCGERFCKSCGRSWERATTDPALTPAAMGGVGVTTKQEETP